MTSLKDAAAARREKRRYQQVIREAHNKDDDALARLKSLKDSQAVSKEQDPEDVVKGTMIETKSDPDSSEKITPLTQLSSETKSGEAGDDLEKQKLLNTPGDHASPRAFIYNIYLLE